jgi:hypothetical protein
LVPRAKKTDVRSVVRELVSTAGGDPSSHLERAASALRIAAEADRYARIEVMAARNADGASWAEVGEALGMTRQSAHERFRTGPDGYHSRWYKLRSST